MDNFLLIGGCLLLGVLLRRHPQMPAEGATVLNQVVLNVSLPALVLLEIPRLVFSPAALVPVLLPWGLLLLFAALVLLLARLIGWSREITGCLLLLVPMGNTSFLGIPMVSAFFGEAAVSWALLYDQLGSFLALSTYGALVLALYGGSGLPPTPSAVLAKILRFPPFIALLIGFSLHLVPTPEATTWPAPVTALLETLAATLVPLVMLAVGWQLTLRLPQAYLGPLGWGLGLKMVAMPLVALGFCLLLGLRGEPVAVAVFEAGMAPMISAGALAILAGLAPSLAAALTGYGIILAFFTLPLLHRLLLYAL